MGKQYSSSSDGYHEDVADERRRRWAAIEQAYSDSMAVGPGLDPDAVRDGDDLTDLPGPAVLDGLPASGPTVRAGEPYLPGPAEQPEVVTADGGDERRAGELQSFTVVSVSDLEPSLVRCDRCGYVRARCACKGGSR